MRLFLLLTVSVTVVRGCRFAVEDLTKRPVTAERLTFRAMVHPLSVSGRDPVHQRVLPPTHQWQLS